MSHVGERTFTTAGTHADPLQNIRVKSQAAHGVSTTRHHADMKRLLFSRLSSLGNIPYHIVVDTLSPAS